MSIADIITQALEIKKRGDFLKGKRIKIQENCKSKDFF